MVHSSHDPDPVMGCKIRVIGMMSMRLQFLTRIHVDSLDLQLVVLHGMGTYCMMYQLRNHL